MDGFDASPAAIAGRRAKVLDPVNGYEYFVNTYFPHYVRSSEKSELHEFLFSRLPEILQQPEGINEADAAPRGEAKSTLVTRLFSLWTVITGAKKVYRHRDGQHRPSLSDAGSHQSGIGV